MNVAPASFALLACALLLSGCWGLLGQGEPEQVDLGSSWKSKATAPRLHLLLGDPHTSGLDGWPDEFQATPLAYDVNGDGRNEIIAYNHDNHVYVFNAETGRVMARLATSLPPGWHVDKALNGLAAAPLAPGQPVSIVATNPAGYVYVWRFDAGNSDEKQFQFPLQWQRRMNDCFAHPAIDAKPVLADLNGDKTLEILVQTEEPGLFALRADGKLHGHHCWGGGNAAPVVADLNGDQSLEVIFASDDGVVSVFDGATFRPRWSFNAADPTHGIKPASISASPTVAELDGKLPREIVFTARQAPRDDPEQYGSFHMAIFAVREAKPGTSELVWMRQPSWANPLSNTELIVLDVDRDGKSDIFGMDWNTIGHRPGNWERLGPANLFRLRFDGTEVWHRPLGAYWSNQEIAVSDSDGDGELDVLAAAPVGGGDGLWRFSAQTGAPQGSIAVPGWTILRGPTMIPGSATQPTQLMFPAHRTEPKDPEGAILLIELGKTKP